jgi:DNA processing protein
MNTTEILALKLIPGIGTRSIINIINSGQTITDLISQPETELKRYIKGNQAQGAIQALKHHSDDFIDKASIQISNLESRGISIISYVDDIYPTFFKLIRDWPVFLYAKGNLNLLQEQMSIAIVGTRECSDDGRVVAKLIASVFGKVGVNIVSGLALGIDTAAHEGALSVGGATTAVLVDVDNIYPKENKQLSEKILDGNGLLIAENPPGVKMVGGLFATRDRLQSALSLAVFPVETGRKGGTMHTVRYAEEQNRLLYCPDYSGAPDYPKHREQSLGVSELIKSGRAKPITSQDYQNIYKIDLFEKKHELTRALTEQEHQESLFK